MLVGTANGVRVNYCDECGAAFDTGSLGNPPAASCAEHSRWAARRGLDLDSEPTFDEGLEAVLLQEAARPRQPPVRLPSAAELALGSIGAICDFFQVDTLEAAASELEDLPDEQADVLAERIRHRMDDAYWHLRSRAGTSRGGNDDQAIVADDQVYLAESLSAKQMTTRRFKFHMLYSPALAVPDPGYVWASHRLSGVERDLAIVSAELRALEPLARLGGLFLLPPAEEFRPRVQFYGYEDELAAQTLSLLSTDLPDLFFDDAVLRREALASDMVDAWERELCDDDTEMLERMAMDGQLASAATWFMRRRYPHADDLSLTRALQMGVLMRDSGFEPATKDPTIASHLRNGSAVAEAGFRNAPVQLPLFGSVSAVDLLRLREDADLTEKIREIAQLAMDGADASDAASSLSNSLSKNAKRMSTLGGVATAAISVGFSVLAAPHLVPVVGAVGAAVAGEASSAGLARVGGKALGRWGSVARRRARVATAQAVLREIVIQSSD